MKKLFKLKRLLKARNKSGFTLVEVIISCSLLAILVLGIMSFVTPVLKMLSSGQKNARATMLAETVDTYISGVLRTAPKVEVFRNIPIASSSTANFNASAYGSGISNIDAFMSDPNNKDEAGNSIYEVRALGIITKNEGDSNRQGVRIYNMDVDQNTYAANMSTKSSAFHDLMFEGLYAIVNIDPVITEKSDGTKENHKGYGVETLVYTDSKCYDIEEEQRDKSLLVFQGITYFENLNFKDPASDVCELASLQDAMDAYAEGSSGGLFYPATIIYYVAPKK